MFPLNPSFFQEVVSLWLHRIEPDNNYSFLGKYFIFTLCELYN